MTKQANTAADALRTLARLITAQARAAEMLRNERDDWKRVAEVQRSEIAALRKELAQLQEKSRGA